MSKTNNILKTVIRFGIGIFFIVSAILKLLALDHFELYIYSFHIVNLTLSGLVARGIIACEILVGLLLILKVRYKEAWWLTMLMLVGFSFLLIYVILFRDDSNCHCMGDLVEIKPWLSLVKNLIAIALLLFVRKEDDYQFGPLGRKLALTGAFLAALVPPFVLFPIDDVYNLFSKSGTLNYDETAFNGLMADSSMQDVHIEEGNYIVGVISSNCQFCRTSCLKVSEIVENNHLDTCRILFFVWGDSTSIEQFKTDTKTESFRYVTINPITAVHVTRGSFPEYLYLKNGEVVKTADLRQLTENSICDHMR